MEEGDVMFGTHKVVLTKDLYEKVKKVALASGYSSVEEFVIHILEKTVSAINEELSEEEVRKRLKGLGYLG